MSIKKTHLNKLLQAFYLPENKLITMLRTDIRNELKKEKGEKSSGGDFYVPFWSDAKKHVSGKSDLRDTTPDRISKNPQRRNLYPKLQEGFLDWYDKKRRWRNEPFVAKPIDVKGKHEFASHDSTVKIENMMALSIGEDQVRIIYPYFVEEPKLTDESARLGLWLLSNALARYGADDIRLFDVQRATTYSLETTPLIGNEEELFLTHYIRIIQKWEELRRLY